MLQNWWLTHVKYSDPGYRQLFYSLRVVITMLIAGLVCAYFSLSNTIWLIIASFFTTLSQKDVGYKAQIKPLIITGILATAAIGIGSFSGNNVLIHAIILMGASVMVYQAMQKSLMSFVMLLMPLLTIVIAGAYPTTLSLSIDRSISAFYGVLIAWTTGLLLFPYNVEKTIPKIELAFSFYLIEFYNLIFLSYLTGNRRITGLDETCNKLTSLLKQLNQHMVYLKEPKIDKREIIFFNLFSQGYFLTRLLHEPPNPDHWLHDRKSLEAIRQSLHALATNWHLDNKKAAEINIEKLKQIQFNSSSQEITALSDSIQKISISIKELLSCQT